MRFCEGLGKITCPMSTWAAYQHQHQHQSSGRLLATIFRCVSTHHTPPSAQCPYSWCLNLLALRSSAIPGVQTQFIKLVQTIPLWITLIQPQLAAAKYVGCWTLHRQQLYIPTLVDMVFTVLFFTRSGFTCRWYCRNMNVSAQCRRLSKSIIISHLYFFCSLFSIHSAKVHHDLSFLWAIIDIYS